MNSIDHYSITIINAKQQCFIGDVEFNGMKTAKSPASVTEWLLSEIWLLLQVLWYQTSLTVNFVLKSFSNTYCEK